MTSSQSSPFCKQCEIGIKTKGNGKNKRIGNMLSGKKSKADSEEKKNTLY